jgi:hypothetical protein
MQGCLATSVPQVGSADVINSLKNNIFFVLVPGEALNN